MQPIEDAIDRKLLDIVQVEFPLEPRPFAELGRRVGIGEDEVVRRIARLKENRGPIRQISAIFDSTTLGYASTLVAGQYDPDRLEDAARVVCEHPGVSHCYERDSRYNLWYTLAVPPTSALGLDRTIERLSELSAAIRTRKFPTLRLFKIGVVLDIVGQRESTGTGGVAASTSYTAADRSIAQNHALDEADLPLIRALQTDIVIEPRPFDRLAEEGGCSVDTLLAAARRLIERRQMRRYAAVLRHREAGFVANCMVCWNVPEGDVEAIGSRMAEYDAVSHCYLRPAYDDWPYNIYTMIHGQSREDCLSVVEAISADTCTEHPMPLWSTREFKKTRVRYFTGQTEVWEREHAEEGA